MTQPMPTRKMQSHNRFMKPPRRFLFHNRGSITDSRRIRGGMSLRVVEKVGDGKSAPRTAERGRFCRLSRPRLCLKPHMQKSTCNALKGKRQKADEPAILTPAAREITTGTKARATTKSAPAMAAGDLE